MCPDKWFKWWLGVPSYGLIDNPGYWPGKKVITIKVNFAPPKPGYGVLSQMCLMVIAFPLVCEMMADGPVICICTYKQV